MKSQIVTNRHFAEFRGPHTCTAFAYLPMPKQPTHQLAQPAQHIASLASQGQQSMAAHLSPANPWGQPALPSPRQASPAHRADQLHGPNSVSQPSPARPSWPCQALFSEAPPSTAREHTNSALPCPANHAQPWPALGPRPAQPRDQGPAMLSTAREAHQYHGSPALPRPALLAMRSPALPCQGQLSSAQPNTAQLPAGNKLAGQCKGRAGHGMGRATRRRAGQDRAEQGKAARGKAGQGQTRQAPGHGLDKAG